MLVFSVANGWVFATQINTYDGFALFWNINLKEGWVLLADGNNPRGLSEFDLVRTWFEVGGCRFPDLDISEAD
ncbi:hypothetical protein [Geothrix edaphica]|uniref:Uncharacterized protein n=1 Tax=Geothrix edaphica TaxID=2927976 RepID=A0ABQ5PXR8_9BACT|nr:hypothetical protein [Geothrix edaphica]GLH67164.1 hypothetical protein GETHED_15280 [Geothrix edaphica]